MPLPAALIALCVGGHIPLSVSSISTDNSTTQFSVCQWSTLLSPVQALLPVAGVPAIEYTLQFLADNGVVEILLFAVSHVSQLKRYLEGSRWASHLVTGGAPTPGAPEPSSPRVRVLTSGSVTSAGDALRAIDGMGVLRSDSVVLVDGPVVANFRLGAALAAHAERAKQDSNAILTVLVTQLSTGPDGVSPLRSGASGGPLTEELRLTLNPEDGRIVSYDLVNPVSAAYPATLSAKSRETDPKCVVRRDLADSRVYIASHEAFIHFSDNYDYQDVRKHYLHNEVLNVDMGFRFNAHLVSGAGVYAGALSDARALAALTADVIANRCCPYSPAGNWWAPPLAAAATASSNGNGSTPPPPPAAPWHSPSRGVLVQAGAAVSPHAQLGPGTVVFAGASVAADARLSGAVIAPKAVVGTGATLNGCVVMSGALIGAEAKVGNALIGPSGVVGAGSHVPDGCVLGADVIIGDGHHLPPFSRVTCAAPADGGLLGGSGAATPSLTTHKGRITASGAAGGSDAAMVGPAGVGRLWPAEDELEDEEGSDSDDESLDEEEDGADVGGSAAGYDPKHAGAAMSALRSALKSLAAARRASSSSDGSSDNSSLGPALATLAAATRAALSVPLLPSSVGVHDLEAALVYLASAPKAAASPATTAQKGAPAAAGVASSSAASNSSVNSSSAPSAPSAVDRFAAGVTEILTAPGVKASDARSLAMEVKSFRFSENRTSADCLRAALPVLLGAIPCPPGCGQGAYLTAMKKALAEWQPFLAVFEEGAGELHTSRRELDI